MASTLGTLGRIRSYVDGGPWGGRSRIVPEALPLRLRHSQVGSQTDVVLPGWTLKPVALQRSRLLNQWCGMSHFRFIGFLRKCSGCRRVTRIAEFDAFRTL